jgi:hypothetical protein
MFRFIIRIGHKLVLPLLVIVCILLIAMLQFGFIFLVVALLPSIAAFFVDSGYERSAFRTIFACNLAAIMPTITPMFVSGLKFKHYEIGQTVSDPKVWLYIYSGAAIGWGMIYFGLGIGRVVLSIKHKFKVRMLEWAQEKLLEEWGEQVRGEMAVSTGEKKAIT